MNAVKKYLIETMLPHSKHTSSFTLNWSSHPCPLTSTRGAVRTHATFTTILRGYPWYWWGSLFNEPRSGEEIRYSVVHRWATARNDECGSIATPINPRRKLAVEQVGNWKRLLSDASEFFSMHHPKIFLMPHAEGHSPYNRYCGNCQTKYWVFRFKTDDSVTYEAL